MKKTVISQIVINIILLLLSCLITAGKLIKIKYEYDDPSSSNKPVAISNDMYDLISTYMIIVLLFASINIILSIIINRKIKRTQIPEIVKAVSK